MPFSLDIWSRNKLYKIDCHIKNWLAKQWVVGPMGCRTNGLSNQWAVGPMGCRTNVEPILSRLFHFLNSNNPAVTS